jgi:hypothetical protein
MNISRDFSNSVPLEGFTEHLEMLQKKMHARFQNFDELLTVIACFRILLPFKHEASFSNTGVQILHLPVKTDFA